MGNQLPKLDLNITNRCNLRCRHCAFDSGCTKMPELPLQDLERILSETRALGGERIDITGGEPTLREDFDDILQIAKDKGYKVELVTNGTTLTRERLAHLQSMGLDAIAVSLDGPDYKTHAAIRNVPQEAYERTRATLLDARALGIRTKVNSLAAVPTMAGLPALTQWCIDKKFAEHGIYYFTPVGRGELSKELVIDPVLWLAFIRKELAPLDKLIPVAVEVPFIEKDFPKKTKTCIIRDDPYHLQILPDGKVYPCAILAAYGKSIGDLHTEHVGDIWLRAGKEDYKRQCASAFTAASHCCFGTSILQRRDMIRDRYRFVCPLRKYRAGELVWPSS